MSDAPRIVSPVTRDFAAWFFALLVLCGPFIVDAQEPTPIPLVGTLIVTGTVQDTAGNPLSGAEVYTLDGRRTLTDENGVFYLDKVPAGSVDVVFRRIGYLPASLGFDSQPGLKVSLAAKLVSTAQTLSTVIIEGRSLRWTLFKGGFYKRQEQGRGIFITPEQLENNESTLSSILRRVPGVRVENSRGASRATVLNLYTRGRCTLPVFIDGAPIPWAAEQGLDYVMKRQDILAIEVYDRTSKLPLSFRNNAGPGTTGDFNALMSANRFSGGCGAILLWTKPVQAKLD